MNGPIRVSVVTALLLASSAVLGADEKKTEVVLTGLWNGSYSYAGDGTDRPDVPFTAVIIQKGKEVTGFIREANTFGSTDDPWLHAALKGTIDAETRKLTFTKTYDGTSNVGHDVEYSATMAEKEEEVKEGVWKLGEAGGTFKLAKDPKVTTGKLSGMWRGENIPPKDSEIPTVKISLVLLHQGDQLVGFAREPRVGQDGINPWFHATIKGTYDAKSGAIKLLKSYDGTAKARAQEEYLGKIGEDGRFTGKRISDDQMTGQFELKQDKE